jgi:protein-arginine deiminase
MTAGMVNMLVTNGHCAVPKPFGPVVGGMDKFQEEAKAKLSALGLAVEFVDDWFTYHVQLGEVHCGTNTLRREKQFAWWEFEP